MKIGKFMTATLLGMVTGAACAVTVRAVNKKSLDKINEKMEEHELIIKGMRDDVDELIECQEQTDEALERISDVLTKNIIPACEEIYESLEEMDREKLNKIVEENTKEVVKEKNPTAEKVKENMDKQEVKKDKDEARAEFERKRDRALKILEAQEEQRRREAEEETLNRMEEFVSAEERKAVEEGSEVMKENFNIIEGMLNKSAKFEKKREEENRETLNKMKEFVSAEERKIAEEKSEVMKENFNMIEDMLNESADKNKKNNKRNK